MHSYIQKLGAACYAYSIYAGCVMLLMEVNFEISAKETMVAA